MTVAELMETLSGFNPDSQVRLAGQPAWPFEYSISEVIDAVSDDADSDSDISDLEIVYIAEGRQIDYLNGDVRVRLGWM